MNEQFVIGLDYGSDSARAVLVNTSNGNCLASQVFWYPRWKEGKFCNPNVNQFRQHPLDHLEGLEETVKAILKTSGVDKNHIKAICVDTTGSSPMAVDSKCKSLALDPRFSNNPNAMMVLWKDHTAIAEAEEINVVSRTWGTEDYTKYSGGIYSSEWFWAKILHIIRIDPQIAENAFSWMEHCDYITAQLIGCDDPMALKRSRCAAGHKALWHQSWGGLPPKEFLDEFHPYLGALRNRLYTETYTSDQAAGNLSKLWADKLGLTENTVIAVGTFDAHAGAVGGEISENTLVKVMGTSTCDIMVASGENLGKTLVKGICGQVDGSVIPGTIGLEAGQSGFGDVLAWFKNLLIQPSISIIQKSTELDNHQKEVLSAALEDQMLTVLTEQAIQLPEKSSGIIALDWINGRRTPDANQSLKGALLGLNMGSDAPRIFKSLVEAICFGSKKIVDRFKEEGVRIDSIIGIGGVAKKSNFVMQTLADVLDMPIKIASSDQTPALGAAMYAAVAAGIHLDIQAAIQAMGNGFDGIYKPDPEQVRVYQELYEQYLDFGKFVEEQLKFSPETSR